MTEKTESKLAPPSLKLLRINDKGASALIKNVRLNFVSIAEPRPSLELDDAGNPKKYDYEITLMIPKGAKVLQEIHNLVDQVIEQSSKIPAALKKQASATAKATGKERALFKDGDKAVSGSTGKPYDGLPGHLYFKAHTAAEKVGEGFRAKQDLKLVLWDSRTQTKQSVDRGFIADHFYSGIWADVSLNFAGYLYMKKPGVTVYLGGIMKLLDDRRLGGFDPFEARDDIEVDDDAGDAPEGY